MKFSIFRRLTSKVPFHQEMTFNELLALFEEAATSPSPVREENELWSPGVYEGVQRRNKTNVSYADIIGLDCDDPSNDIFDVLFKIEESNVNYIAYTSYRHDDNAHRFRILLPLSSPITTPHYDLAFDACNRWLSPTIFDQACSDISRIFFMPTINPARGACEVFSYNDGNDLDWQVLNRVYGPAPAPTPSPALKAFQKALATMPPKSAYSKKLFHNDLLNSTLVPSRFINDYLAISDGYHVGFYKVLCRIASRAKTFGYPLTEMELTQIASDIDHYDKGGPWYTAKTYNRESKNAMIFAGLSAAPMKAVV